MSRRHAALFVGLACWAFFAAAPSKFVAAQPEGPETPAAKRVWLSDLPEQKAKVGHGKFGKNGQLGFDGEAVQIHYQASPHGLGMHPKSHVEYQLGKKYRTFRGTAAINVTSGGGSQKPVEFTVLGDGKLLWKSSGLHRHSDHQACLLDITGVDLLTLEVDWRPDTQGDPRFAHAVWIEPYVAVDPPDPKQLPFFHPDTERVHERILELEAKVKDLLVREKFEELEALAADLRKRDLVIGSAPARDIFYEAIGGHEGADWNAHFARLERWKKAEPESLAVLIAYGKAHVHRAWEARGHELASRVTDEGRAGFREHLAKAREYLEDAADKRIPEASIYTALIAVALGEGRSRAETFSLFESGLKASQRSWGLYEQMATYLSPQWGGKPNDLRLFAGRLRDRVGGDLGEEVFFRIGCSACFNAGYSFFEETGFKYEELQPGLRVVLRDRPEHERMLNYACFMASLAGDKEVAGLLFDRLDVATSLVLLWRGSGKREYYRRKFDPHAEPGEELKTLLNPEGWATGVAFLNDENRIVTGGEDFALSVWDLKTDKVVERIKTEAPVQCLAVDGAGKTIIIATGTRSRPNPSAAVYSPTGAFPRYFLRGHTGGMVDSAVTRDATRFASAAQDNTVRLWDPAKPERPTILKHPEWCYDVEFSPDGKTVATATYQGGLWLWNAESGQQLGKPLVEMLKGPWMNRLRFLPGGKELISASGDGVLRRWDLAARTFKEGKAPGNQIVSLDLSADGHWLALGRQDGRVDLARADTLAVVHTFEGHYAAVEGVAFSPSGKLLASASSDTVIKIWGVEKFQK